MDHWFTWTFTQVIFVEMLNWLIDELAFVELVICLTDFCSAQMWWNLHFDELTFDELTFCSVGFDQFSLLNFSCLVDMEPIMICIRLGVSILLPGFLVIAVGTFAPLGKTWLRGGDRDRALDHSPPWPPWPPAPSTEASRAWFGIRTYSRSFDGRDRMMHLASFSYFHLSN